MLSLGQKSVPSAVDHKEERGWSVLPEKRGKWIKKKKSIREEIILEMNLERSIDIQQGINNNQEGERVYSVI